VIFCLLNKPFENLHLLFLAWWQRWKDPHRPKATSMASGFSLPLPVPLALHDQNALKKLSWENTFPSPMSVCPIAMIKERSQCSHIAYPWTKVATDLCEFDSRVLLVICDYYSNFIEVVYLGSITSQAIIKELKAIFARFGVPDTLVTENGPQFSSAEFSVFSRTWMFETSSPPYPQSNGKAENAVRRLLRICLQSARQLEHQSFKHS